MTLDTHKFARRRQEGGFDQKQAEAVADAFYDAAADVAPVTRDYFDVKLKAEIETAQADIIKWVAGLLIAQAAVSRRWSSRWVNRGRDRSRRCENPAGRLFVTLSPKELVAR
jgi:hypothetical protein